MAVEAYSRMTGFPIVAWYDEVQTGRKADLRIDPDSSLRSRTHARRSRAQLVIARLDHLAQNVFRTSQLLQSGVDFVACDTAYANRLTIQIRAAMAEHESRMISEGTRVARRPLEPRGLDFSRPENSIPEHCQKLGTAAANRASIERSGRVYRSRANCRRDPRGRRFATGYGRRA